MAYIVTAYDSEAALQAGINASLVQTYDSEQALEDFLNTLTTEVITQIMAKGAKYTVVLDADVTPNTLAGIGSKGGKFVAVVETP